MDVEDENVVDHKYNIRNDNRVLDLRVCTWQKNAFNTSKKEGKATSIYKGVYLHSQNNTWIAQIMINFKQQYIGSYSSQEDAAIAYNNKAVELFGEYAKLNIIKDIDFEEVDGVVQFRQDLIEDGCVEPIFMG